MNFSNYCSRQICFALALCLAGFAHAQEITNKQEDISVARRLEWIRKGLTTVGEQKDSADISTKREDIRKLLSVTGVEDLLKQTLPTMIAQMRYAMPQVPDETWRELERSASINELIEIYIPIYEKHYSHEDIKGMLAFYNTPLGKKVIATMPVVMKEAMEMGNKWGIDLAKRVEQKNSKPEQSLAASLAAKLTPDQKAWALQRSGYDPEKFALDDDGFVSPRPQQPAIVSKNLIKQDKESTKIADDDPQLGRELLISRGFNPDEWELKPINGSFAGTFPTRKASAIPATQAGNLPPGVHFIIRYNNSSGESTTYYSKEEPKPVGSGFKFKMFSTDVEFTLSGNVEIIKIPDSKKGM